MVEICLTLSKQRILLTRLMHVVFAIPSCPQSHIFILIRLRIGKPFYDMMRFFLFLLVSVSYHRALQ